MKRKIAAFLLAVIMLATLTACNSKRDSTDSNSSVSQTTADATTAASAKK